MKRIVYVVIGLIAGCLIGRFSVKPEVRTEVVTEYRPILSSITKPSSISQPIGSRIEKVKMLRKELVLNIGRADDVKEVNFPIINQIGDSAEIVENIEETDSAIVELPVRDYTFTDDSTYRITARGVYVESLPDVQFWSKRTTTSTQTTIRPRINHGLQMGGGVALTPDGFKPALYVGYGLTINF